MPLSMLVGALCHKQGYGFSIAEVRNMTLAAALEWVKQEDSFIRMLTGDKQATPEDPERTRELIEQASRDRGVRIPKVFPNANAH